MEIEGEADSLRDIDEKMVKPYKAALKKDWEGFKEFYKSNPQDLLSPLTVNRDTAFHLAAGSGNESLLQDLFRILPPSKRREALTKKDSNGNTALHEVAITGSVASARILVSTLLLECGGDKQGIAEEENRGVGELLLWTNLGETPLYRAVALGKTKMAKYFASVIEENGDIKKHYRRNRENVDDKISILHIAVMGQHFDTAIWILGKDKELGEKEEHGMKCLHLLALMPSAFKNTISMSRLKRLIYSRIPIEILDDGEDNESQALSSQPREDLETGKKNSVSQQSEKSSTTAFSRAAWKALIQGWPIIMDIVKDKKKHESAGTLLKMLVKQDTSWKKMDNAKETPTICLGKGPENEDKPKSTTRATEEEEEEAPVYGVSSSDTPILVAAKTGNIEVFKEILEQYPQAVEYTDENRQNVLHLAILHRRWEIFKHIKDNVTQISMNKMAARIDKDGCTILHQTAAMRYYTRGTRPGPALQLQEELEWFQRVAEIIPSHYDIHRNKYNKTAKELFEIRHKSLLKDAQDWIKHTSGSCSTVSVLVATVVFAAAYTVPGGTNTQGLPVFLHSALFTLFTVMDVVSLVISLTSVVMFLSILTSPFEQSDFLISLPRKLILGFTFLFFSVITTMITFTASILLLIRLEKRWTTTLIYMAAFIPVAMFGIMQFPLYTSFLSSLKTIFEVSKKYLPGKRRQTDFLKE